MHSPFARAIRSLTIPASRRERRRSARLGVETLEDRALPAFQWPTGLEWPTYDGQPAAWLANTVSRREYSQTLEIGSFRYVLTVNTTGAWTGSPGSDGTELWTATAGSVYSTFTTYDGEQILSATSSLLALDGPASGQLAPGTLADIISGGAPPGAEELHEWADLIPGWTRWAVSDSYRSGTFGYVNGDAAFGYQLGAGRTFQGATSRTNPDPRTYTLATNENGSWQEEYRTSFPTWDAGPRPVELDIDTGGSGTFSRVWSDTTLTPDYAPHTASTFGVWRSDGTSWDRSMVKVYYGDPNGTAPDRAFGWEKYRTDETGSTTRQGGQQDNYSLNAMGGRDYLSGSFSDRYTERANVAESSTESEHQYVYNTPVTGDDGVVTVAASGRVYALSQLTGGSSETGWSEFVNVDNGATQLDSGSEWVSASGTMYQHQEAKAAEESKYTAPDDPLTSAGWTIVAELADTREGMYDTGVRIDRNHLTEEVRTTSQDFWCGTVSSKSMTDRTGWAWDESPFTRIIGTRAETSSDRSGSEFRDAKRIDTAIPNRPVTTILNSTDRYEFSGRDRVANTRYDAAAPDVTDEKVALIRRDAGEATAVDVWLTDGVPEHGVVQVATDLTGRTDHTIWTLDDGFYSAPENRIGTGGGKYHEWQDVTDGHRGETNTYRFTGKTAEWNARDKYEGGFSVNWAVTLDPDSGIHRESSQVGSGTSSGYLIAATARENGSLTGGTVSIGWAEKHNVTVRTRARDDWNRFDSDGFEERIQVNKDRTDDWVTAGYTVVGASWRETDRKFHQDDWAQETDDYVLSQRVWEGGTSFATAPSARKRNVIASSTQENSAKADGTHLGGTYKREQFARSLRSASFAGRTVLAEAGELSQSDSTDDAWYEERRKVEGTLTVGGGELVTSFDYFRENWTHFHIDYQTYSPSRERLASNDSYSRSMYSSSGSPTAGIRVVLNTGEFSSNWRERTLPGGEWVPGGVSYQTGNPTATVTTWPVETSWWQDGWVGGMWTLVRESSVGQTAGWIWSHGADVARVGFGFVDFLFGLSYTVYTSGFGGAAGGVALMGIGLDQMITGVANIRYGRRGPGFSALEGVVYEATGSTNAAILTPTITSFGLVVAIRWGASGAWRFLEPRQGELAILAKPGARGTLTNDPQVRMAMETLSRVYGMAYVQSFSALAGSIGDTLLVVIGHGVMAANRVRIGNVSYTAAELAEALLRTAPATTTHVKLLACAAGNRRFYGLQSSLAQEVANRTGWVVTAPRGWVKVYDNGAARVRPIWMDDYLAPGLGWGVYRPGAWWLW